MKKNDLGGSWRLAFFDENGKLPETPEQMRCFSCQRGEAQVPGNVELDLMRAGLLPQDIYFGDNILLLRQYESYQWWYERDFITPDWEKVNGTELVFEGLDCFATIWINNALVGESDNAMIGHSYNISEFIKPAGEVNILDIRLNSARNAVKELPLDIGARSNLIYQREGLWARKPSHQYGWDIMPRAISAGIWRPVYLRELTETRFQEVFIDTVSVSDIEAKLEACISFETKLPLNDFSLKITGKCGDFSFNEERILLFNSITFDFTVEMPKLWWPRGYGLPNLYDVSVQLVWRGQVVTETIFTLGIRTIRLEHTNMNTPEEPGHFLFRVNGEPIFCRGSNWVPADVFHSRDAQIIPKIVDLFIDMSCNMLRCWGGNVYEDHTFYDLCDRAGIMVWQDFGMACASYPQHPGFLEKIRIEAEWVVKSLRQHPCIALWCGDNEVDTAQITWHIFGQRRRDPNKNRINRDVISEVIRNCDPSINYLPSSPYVSPDAFEMFIKLLPKIKLDFRIRESYMPEQHYYPRGLYFKKALPVLDSGIFFSETGYHGSIGVTSIHKFMPADKLRPDPTDPMWLLHSTSPVPEYNTDRYIKTLYDQVAAHFGAVPEDPEDFAAASQINQAEGMKFIVERLRQRKWLATGVLWWNMIDGWPQFSCAVVDYYFEKKLAYYYLKRAHDTLAMIICEPMNGQMAVVVVNDSLQCRSGSFRIWDADSGETLLTGHFNVNTNSSSLCGSIECPVGEQRLYLIEYEYDGNKGCNHYVFGEPPFDLVRYRCNWLPQIASLDHAFSADHVGK